MEVAASRDDEKYSLSMELATQEIQFALAEKVGHQLWTIYYVLVKCVHLILDFKWWYNLHQFPLQGHIFPQEDCEW